MAYARIEEGFWTDPMIKSLSLEGKILAAWLFTNPHRHFSGIYYLPRVLIADQIGVSVGVSNRELNILEEKDFLKYSDEFSIVWVIKMLHHQSGGVVNDKQGKGISTHLKTLHGCPLIIEFLEYYKQFKIIYDTPIHTPMDTKSQSQSQSKSKSKYKESSASPSNGDALPTAVPIPFYTCKHFELDNDFIAKLLQEYPALNQEAITAEISKAHDWLDDNPDRHKRRANGHLKNPRTFLKNWLNRAIINPKGQPKGFQGKGIMAWASKQEDL